MTDVTVIKIMRESLMTTLIVSAPMLGVGMFVGLIISIFQTTTSIQEQTLTFVPKIVAIFVVHDHFRGVDDPDAGELHEPYFCDD